jgi:hypothetical protein
MSFRLKTSAESQAGFATAISQYGTSNWTTTLLPAGSISFLRKLRWTPNKAFSTIGQSRGEIRRDAPVLESL